MDTGKPVGIVVSPVKVKRVRGSRHDVLTGLTVGKARYRGKQRLTRVGASATTNWLNRPLGIESETSSAEP